MCVKYCIFLDFKMLVPGWILPRCSYSSVVIIQKATFCDSHKECFYLLFIVRWLKEEMRPWLCWMELRYHRPRRLTRFQHTDRKESNQGCGERCKPLVACFSLTSLMAIFWLEAGTDWPICLQYLHPATNNWSTSPNILSTLPYNSCPSYSSVLRKLKTIRKRHIQCLHLQTQQFFHDLAPFRFPNHTLSHFQLSLLSMCLSPCLLSLSTNPSSYKVSFLFSSSVPIHLHYNSG